MSPPLEAPRRAGSPWQRLYRGAHAARRRWYAKRRRRLPAPVLSIGNLHWGGTGKTPLVAAVAAYLVERDLPVAILSRGYGRKDHAVRVVSLGHGPVLGPLVAGDEPVMLAGQVPGAAVVVAPNRYEAGRHAMERISPPPKLFLLDDGFSHLRLERDLDILTFPARDPFAGGRLWPGGRLREPLEAVRHADAVVMTGAEGDGDGDGDALAAALEPFGFTGPGFSSRTRVLAPRTVAGDALPRGASVFLVSAIAGARRFVDAVRTQAVKPRGALELGDHDPFSDATVREIEAAWRASGADYVLTTSKDRVKLFGRLEVPLAELPIAAEPTAAFWRWLDERIAALRTGRAREPG